MIVCFRGKILVGSYDRQKKCLCQTSKFCLMKICFRVGNPQSVRNLTKRAEFGGDQPRNGSGRSLRQNRWKLFALSFCRRIVRLICSLKQSLWICFALQLCIIRQSSRKCSFQKVLIQVLKLYMPTLTLILKIERKKLSKSSQYNKRK